MNETLYAIKTLGDCPHRSPLLLSNVPGDGVGNFTPVDAVVLHTIERNTYGSDVGDGMFEKAGAREHLHFKPDEASAAVVTCGGLCPGINNVIRSAYRQLSNYGVRRVLGIRNGYKGMNPAEGLPPVELTDAYVEDIHREGGTVLGSSRGSQDTGALVDFLEQEGLQMLFCVGGDGTQRGAHEIALEIEKRGLDIAVVGIPKTIDNDILYVSRTFGFNTAIEEARKVLDCAHVEAKGAPYGIGLVKLMGRDSGFIAAGATLASQEVNFCLIPEAPFRLDGPGGFLPLLKARMERKQHAVVVVAEGAGQDLISGKEKRKDASGNVLHHDIGVFLQAEIKQYFNEQRMEVNVKYFDPSYQIRSIPANADDSLYGDRLARHAVHAAMAGKTDVLIGRLYSKFMHVPIEMAIRSRKKVDPESDLWISVHETTGQPLQFN